MTRTRTHRLGSAARAWAVVGSALLAAAVVAILRAPSSGIGGEAARPTAKLPDPSSAAAELAVAPRSESGRLSASSPGSEAPPDPLVPRVDPEQTAARFLGRVVADESGAPIADARVGRDDATDAGPVTSDADGRFAWPFDANQREQLLVRAPGRAPRLVWTSHGHTDVAHTAEVRLARGATIDARIRRGPATAGMRLIAAVPRVALHDLTARDAAGPDLRFEAPFTGDGRAWLADLPPRAPLELEVLDGVARTPIASLVLEPGEVRVLDVDLGTGARLIVRVADQHGAPVRDRTVLLLQDPETAPEQGDACYLRFDDDAASFARARTDEAGLAVFANVPAGAWWIGPAKEEPSPARDDVAAVAQRFELADGVRAHELTLHAHRGLYLRGRIVDATGAPVGRAYVGCAHADLGGHVTGDVDDDGRFELGPVAAGLHRVEVIPHGVYLAPEPQQAAPGGPPLVFTLARGAEIAGVVVDAATGAVVRADYLCSRAGALLVHGSLGDDGAFAISGLTAGTYAVAAHTSDGRAGYVDRIELASGRALTGVRVELAPAARVAIHFSGGPERAVCAVHAGGAAVVVDELARGVRREWFVPAGRLRVQLAHGDEPPAVREVDAVPGGPVEVSFDLE